jgi:hypothetical protein
LDLEAVSPRLTLRVAALTTRMTFSGKDKAKGRNMNDVTTRRIVAANMGAYRCL